MTDDIVTRLRKHHEWFGNGGQPTSVWEDAADEIEHLRNAVKVRDLQILANSKVLDAMYEELYGDG